MSVVNVDPGHQTLSLAVSIVLSGCRDEGYSEGAMMVNSINTAAICGQQGRRPLKILFQPSSGQPPLSDCGPELIMSRRTMRDNSVSWSLPGSAGDKQVVHLTADAVTTLTLTLDTRDIGHHMMLELAILTLGAPNEVREVSVKQSFFRTDQSQLSISGDWLFVSWSPLPGSRQWNNSHL